ncbi:hypothetical protein JD844_022139 [Phrynosoma platyrhinos]|uniref:Uncharacterized protein n=1 Tax=Phrynosoma platyrhinos TaxID=52577 RepID=A0ABQ7SUU9_PHRPL|nr:hypothetical protein JD844_022139 [Phrynosoma platyrhinos]
MFSLLPSASPGGNQEEPPGPAAGQVPVPQPPVHPDAPPPGFWNQVLERLDWLEQWEAAMEEAQHHGHCIIFLLLLYICTDGS